MLTGTDEAGSGPSRLNQFARGIRVLDLSSFLPGPLASQILADMGAEVLKVESPSGDAMIGFGPRDVDGKPVFYHSLNAEKTVRRMDLKRAEEREEFLDMIATFDVLIEGFRPGVMARLGLDYPVLSSINPGLVYCSLSGYGSSGPMALVAGHDANYLAGAGVLYRNGVDRPVLFDPPIADVSSSLFGVIAILGALRTRQVDGRGCEIDIGLADTPMLLQSIQVAAYGATGEVTQRQASYLNGAAAYYQIYTTRDDRHLAVGPIEPKFWRCFCLAAERPNWVARYDELLPQTSLINDVGLLIAGLEFSECVARFGHPDCCVSPILDLGEAIASPHHQVRGLVRRTPEGGLEALFPARIDGIAPKSRNPLRQQAPRGA